jgi:hypothetical protein
MRICILGAGWFGCFIADELIKKDFNVTIYEKKKKIFLNASGNNQNRLHLGFHYPRSPLTMKLSKFGFAMFKKKFNKFSKKIENNYYAIVKSSDSKISFKNYCSVMKTQKLKYSNVKSTLVPYLQNLDGIIKCDEELILIDNVKKYYNKKLKKYIVFNHQVKNLNQKKQKFIVDGKEYDIVINCTSFQFCRNKLKNLVYEYCTILLYKCIKKNHPAVTIMDGPFFTLFPWDSNQNYGLYSVAESRILIDSNFNTLEKKVKKINIKFLRKKKEIIEKKFFHFYPLFKKEFKFVKFLNSYRTIVTNKNDTRACKVYEKDNFINVLPGKIDHIFYALQKVEKCLRKF